MTLADWFKASSFDEGIKIVLEHIIKLDKNGTVTLEEIETCNEDSYDKYGDWEVRDIFYEPDTNTIYVNIENEPVTAIVLRELIRIFEEEDCDEKSIEIVQNILSTYE